MGIGDALKIAFFALLLLALALAVMNYIQQASQPKPVLAMNWPAGLVYKGPDTTALAGWYCIESINSSNGYSIQLNAQFNNGEWGPRTCTWWRPGAKQASGKPSGPVVTRVANPSASSSWRQAPFLAPG